MTRLIKFLLLLAVASLGVAFTVLNSTDVTLDYYFGTTEMPFALLLVLALLCGALVGVFASSGIILRLKRENLQLRRKTQLVSQEVNNLRTIPLRDQ